MNLNPRCPKLPFKQASKKADLENASPSLHCHYGIGSFSHFPCLPSYQLIVVQEAASFFVIINKARNEKKTGGKPDSPPKDDSKYNHRAVLGKPHSVISNLAYFLYWLPL
nr:hypothetical protein CFP56_71772 [Quercus suber]